ncbi:hypothetical protein AWC38_SpisGene15612 [Stylophora pistillata]|uniref:Uncharacterized protein n=1 Tax=Stylophora pistillata TaxID=50429 RepID=A0A2B4RUQ5_STYPI|nr:hypothetical protein AWC38_SpisGene15612 [Stylophora pistillata]
MMILCHAMMVFPVLETITALMEDALELHSHACHVKSVTTMHAASSLDTVLSSWREYAPVFLMANGGQNIHARYEVSPHLTYDREHLRDVEKNDKDTSEPVARHFNLPNHFKQHMAICGLSLHSGSTESRKTLEQKLIFQTGSLNPTGINKRFSFH